MSEILVAVLIFAALAGSAIGAWLLYPKLPPNHYDDHTYELIRHVGTIFALMTSLVLGLMITATRTTFEEVDNDVRSLASQFVLMDVTLDEYGPEAAEARRALRTYARETSGLWFGLDGHRGDGIEADPSLTILRKGLDALRSKFPGQAETHADARAQLNDIVRLRWRVAEEARDSAQAEPFIPMLVAWLMVIFMSLGYRAPRARLVPLVYVVSAALIAGTLFLVIDMQRPFSGPIRVSTAPIDRALMAMQQ